MYLQKVKRKETFKKCGFLLMASCQLLAKNKNWTRTKCHRPRTLRQTETNLILGWSRGRDVVLIVNKVAPAGNTGLNVVSKET
jgi:hypothetical protein